MRPAVQAQPANTREFSSEERTGIDYCIVLYIQEFYRVQVRWPMGEPALDRPKRAERVRDGLQGREWLEVVVQQVEGVAEVYLACKKR